ncbi:MAG: class I SAM-dependent methyltransferase [Gammaproteobacteria bacterium]|nr:class I SAM-dependent methyltransferase [Gammaproteobacteria bacterium]
MVNQLDAQTLIRSKQSTDRWWLNEFFWSPDMKAVRESYRDFLVLQESDETLIFRGLRIRCAYGTYHPLPGSSTDLVTLSLDPLLQTAKSFLDVGTGTGAIALYARSKGLLAKGTDCDPKAILLARENANANGLEDVQFACTHLLDGLDADERYDLILFSCPLLMWEERTSDFDHIACDPNGRLLHEFVKKAPAHLSADGRIVLILSSIGDREIIQHACASLEDIEVLRAVYYGATGEWRFIVSARPSSMVNRQIFQ